MTHMRAVVGVVKSIVPKGEGQVMVEFPTLFNKKPQIVTYTSPFYQMNSGGMMAIPEIGTKIIALYNETPNAGESTFYYQSSIVTGKTDPQENTNKNENYTSIQDNDSKAKIYGGGEKPVTQTFTNTAGAGLYIHRDLSTPRMSNNVFMKSESDSEVNVGPIGVQIRNEEGDSICLAGSTRGEHHAARSYCVATRGPQEYKCLNSTINMKIENGGDINIENNSDGTMFLGTAVGMPTPPALIPGAFPWAGNIRLKSRWRNIDLAALGDFSNINIVTKNAKIKISSAGDVEIHTTGLKTPITGVPIPFTGNIKLTSQQGNIDINAPLGAVSIVGGLGVSVGSLTGPVSIVGGASTSVESTVGPVLVNSPTIVSLNATTILRNGDPAMKPMYVPHGGGYPAFTLQPNPTPGVVLPIPPTVPTDGSIPDPQNIPPGGPSLNDYRDGSVLGGAV